MTESDEHKLMVASHDWIVAAGMWRCAQCDAMPSDTPMTYCVADGGDY